MVEEAPDFDQAELLKALEEEEEALLDEPAAALVKPQRLTIQLIAERCVDRLELASLSPDDLAEKLCNDVQRLRLDRLRLGSMDGLDVCNAATHLHLQHNLICEIDGLEFFDKLQYLVLAHNQITKLEGLSHLTTLGYFDASHNQIAAVDWQRQLPPKLLALELQSNPCAEEPGYREAALAALPTLMTLDEERATIKELRAVGRTGLPDPEDDEDEDDEGEEEEGEEEEEEEDEEAVVAEAEAEDGVPGWEASAGAPAAATEDAAPAIDVEQLYSQAMEAHGVDDGSDDFKAKVQAARKRVVDRVAEQRALQERNEGGSS